MCAPFGVLGAAHREPLSDHESGDNATPRLRDFPGEKHALDLAGALQQLEPALGPDQLMGRCLRLKRELSAAYLARTWHPAQIDRLVAQIADAEREIAARSSGEQYGADLAPGQIHDVDHR